MSEEKIGLGQEISKYSQMVQDLIPLADKISGNGKIEERKLVYVEKHEKNSKLYTQTHFSDEKESGRIIGFLARSTGLEAEFSPIHENLSRTIQDPNPNILLSVYDLHKIYQLESGK